MSASIEKVSAAVLEKILSKKAALLKLLTITGAEVNPISWFKVILLKLLTIVGADTIWFVTL
jgi:hypothetical protein